MRLDGFFHLGVMFCAYGENYSRLPWLYFATLCVCDWLKKCRATFSTNESGKTKTNRTLFAALGAGYMYLLPVLIGSLRCLHLL